MKTRILNILVCGVGGQGVSTLSNWLRQLSSLSNYICEGATFKGGAQRMGAIYSEIRIVINPKPNTIISTQIPKGAVDILIALEPWEALRYAQKCNSNTLIVVNSTIEKLYVDRFHKNERIHPITQIQSIFSNVITHNHTPLEQSIQLNQSILEHTISCSELPFTRHQLKSIYHEKN